MAIELPRFKSIVVRSARVGQVKSPRPIRDQADSRALAGIGSAAANIGLGLIAQEKRRAKELEIVDANREIAIGNGFVNQQLVEHKAFANQTTDVEKIREDWTKRDKTIQDFNSKAINPIAKKRLSNTYNTNKAIWQGTSDARVNTIVEDRANASLISRAENIAVGDNSVEVATENELRSISTRAGEPAELLNEEQYKLGKINELIGSGTWDEERKLAIVNRISGLAIRAEDARISNALLGLGASAVIAEGPDTGLIDLDAGIALIKEANATPTQEKDAIKDLEVQWADERRGRSQKNELDWNNTRGAINDTIISGDLSARQEFVENGIDGVGILPEKEQGVYLRAIKADLDAIKNGVAIKTDWAGSYRRVRELIDPLANNEITYGEVLEAYNEELPNIADAQRGTLIEKIIAARDAKAGDLGFAPEDKQIRSVISDFEANDFYLPSESSLEKQLPPEQFEEYQNLSDGQKETFNKNWSVKQENRVLNDYSQWLEKNPEATIDQKEQWLDDVSELPKTEKVKSWLSQVIALAATRGPSFIPADFERDLAALDGPRVISSPKNQADYDKLSKGTQYFDLKGVLRTKQ